MTICCPGCGKKLEPEKGALDRHELHDDTAQSGYAVSVTIVCFDRPDLEFVITADPREG